MALSDDDDEQSADDTETESDSWGVDGERRSSGGGTDQSDPAPLSDLDAASLSRGDPNGMLKRAIDREAGVVIYAYKNGNAGGLSTVPLSETDLASKNE
ncbi:hypothetical protein [Halolamina salifodinae]|uniref:Uncharacterized protein n=1 Tax=Halolamina salifodinae TaxID=1202767 RepID=A0A8T4H171_9EURY|nr:hypothetical protein [Halolamina salifodinae]MBP1988312.1 hypothetical protein [Halolamina salifodinae]